MRDPGRIWSRWIVGATAVLVLAACPFDETVTEGLPCVENKDCGPALDCLNGTCVEGNDGQASCPFQNNGVCDDPSGTGLCAFGSDPADCGGSMDDAGTDGGNGCFSFGVACEPGAAQCCDGLDCYETSPGQYSCATTCASGSSCPTCCCLNPSGSSIVGVCVDTASCSSSSACELQGPGCAALGSLCVGGELGECCDGVCGGLSGSSFTRCEPPVFCSSPTDCSNGCCVFHPLIGANVCGNDSFSECI